MIEDLESLLSDLKTVHEDLKPISTGLVVVADWVRLKCRYGCRGYGSHFCCPPFAPSPQETRKVLSEYRQAVLVRIQVPPSPDPSPDSARAHVFGYKTKLQRAVFELEKKAFLSGYYKAFGMSSSPCHLCKICVAKEKLDKGEPVELNDAMLCRHKDVMRPSLEACGIDVFQTLRNAGYSPAVLKDFSEGVDIFGMVLLE